MKTDHFEHKQEKIFNETAVNLSLRTTPYSVWRIFKFLFLQNIYSYNWTIYTPSMHIRKL